MRVDFLSSVFGIGDIELSQSAILFEGEQHLAGVRVKILNPMLCLEGKIKSAIGLPQQGRQDLKHIQMSLLFVKEYIKEAIEHNARQGLKLIERIALNTWSDAGLKLWYLYGVEIDSAMPTSTDINTIDPKWNTFQTIRLPQIEKETVKKRAKYSEIQITIEERIKKYQNRSRNVDIYFCIIKAVRERKVAIFTTLKGLEVKTILA